MFKYCNTFFCFIAVLKLAESNSVLEITMLISSQVGLVTTLLTLTECTLGLL